MAEHLEWWRKFKADHPTPAMKYGGRNRRRCTENGGPNAKLPATLKAIFAAHNLRCGFRAASRHGLLADDGTIWGQELNAV